MAPTVISLITSMLSISSLRIRIRTTTLCTLHVILSFHTPNLTILVPSHLHGHKFQIVNRVEQFDSDDPTLNPPLVEGQANPMRRDTIVIPGGGSVTLRVVADNPGAWMFHC